MTMPRRPAIVAVHSIYSFARKYMQNNQQFGPRYVAKLEAGHQSSFRCGRGRSRTSPTYICPDTRITWQDRAEALTEISRRRPERSGMVEARDMPPNGLLSDSGIAGRRLPIPAGNERSPQT